MPNVFPWTQGLPEGVENDFIILPWNDLDLVRKTVAERAAEIAAIITEPIMCNNGCIEPAPGFLQGLRDICTENNIALIFDEVITGFRISLGGAQTYFGVTPDLSIFAKAIASGYAISAIVGKYEWMQLIEQARVIHAGTMNANNPTVAAALATIAVLEKERPHENMIRLGRKLMEGLKSAAAATGHAMLVEGPGPMFAMSFTSLKKTVDYRDTLMADKAKLGRFIAGMHDEGIRVIGRGLWYISAVHNDEDIDRAVATVEKVLKNI